MSEQASVRPPVIAAVDEARASLRDFAEAAERYRAAAYQEMELEAERAGNKAEAIRRIMAAQGLAATPAEKLAETDPEYAAHLRIMRQKVFEKNEAWAETECARLRVRLAIACITAGV